jgi:hypothetical protein
VTCQFSVHSNFFDLTQGGSLGWGINWGIAIVPYKRLDFNYFSLRRRATAEFSPAFQGRGKRAASFCRVASATAELDSIVAKATAVNLVISSRPCKAGLNSTVALRQRQSKQKSERLFVQSYVEV